LVFNAVLALLDTAKRLRLEQPASTVGLHAYFRISGSWVLARWTAACHGASPFAELKLPK
jgi:hypothetical protein